MNFPPKISNKLDVKPAIILLVASVIISLPYFLYSPRQGLMAVLVLMMLFWVNKILFLCVSVYSLLLNVFFLHLVTKWGNGSLVSRIQASYESATYERWEYFKTYFDVIDIVLIVVYVIAASLAIFYMLKRHQFSVYSRKILFFISAFMIGLSLFIFPTLETLKNFQLVHLPLTVYSTYSNLSIINKRADFLQTAENLKRDCPNPYDKIIFIQGESANKNHLGIYGYERDTTPFLGSLKTYKFDAISPTNQTRLSIPLEFTDATVQDFPKFYQSKSIVSLLAECGYTTYWISNQGKTGEYDTTVTSIANEADHKVFLNDLDYTTAGLDEEILGALDSIEVKNTEKQALFIHLLGSHVSYSDRYPADNAFISEGSSDDVIAQYDNSIRYTDTIISEIYKRFNNEHALYIYLSDHSEVVEKEGHGFSPSFKEEFEIPFVIWSLEQEKIAKLFDEVKDKTLNTESINNIIKYLVGIDDNVNASYSSDVLSVIPSNIVDYLQLPSGAKE